MLLGSKEMAYRVSGDNLYDLSWFACTCVSKAPLPCVRSGGRSSIERLECDVPEVRSKTLGLPASRVF